MVSSKDSGKSSGDTGDTGEHGHGHGGKHSFPEGHHEIPAYAFKNVGQTEKRGHPFWHPAPKDLPEPPIHFHKNAVHLELHLGDPRQRLAGMTDAEREWRRKWVQDQQLEMTEPVYVPEFGANFNPIRRIYRWPWDTLERRVLIPALGFTKGHYVRMFAPKIFIGYVLFSWFYYHVKYCHPTWMDYRRMEIIRMDQPLLREEEIREKEPGLLEKGFRYYQDKRDYSGGDFKYRYTHLELDPPVRP